jgi:hypothetical protein
MKFGEAPTRAGGYGQDRDHQYRDGRRPAADTHNHFSPKVKVNSTIRTQSPKQHNDIFSGVN